MPHLPPQQKGYDAPEKEVAAFAGHFVLSELYPGQQSKFDVALQKQLGGSCRDVWR